MEKGGTLGSDASVFLRPEASMEPLVCGWYAWSYLVSPAQHALNIVHRHIPLLQSFVKNPGSHVAAATDPSLFGGPFVSLNEGRVPEVRQLLRETETRCANLIALANDFKRLDIKLHESATGFSLSEFYSQLPPSWAGLLEFHYDINHQPKIRICEELLYDEDLGAESQEIILSLQRDEERAFFMSTPRLRSPDAIVRPMPFSDRRLDLLSSMRIRAAPIAQVAREFCIPSDQMCLFHRLFTAEAPPRCDPEYLGAAVRIRYFGHACVLIQSAGTSILIDPMLTRDLHPSDGRFTIHDLPDRIDYLLLSHNHQDHCSPEMLIQLRHRVECVVVPRNNSGNIADPSMKLALQYLGFQHIVVLEPFEQVRIGDGVITSLPFPGEHVDLDIYSRHGIHIEIMGRKLVFLVDSDGRDCNLYRRTVKRVGRNIDALFLGMECHGAPLSWLYGPLLSKAISRKNDESRRLSGLDSERAWQVLQEFSARNVFVYAMGQEPWLKYIMGLQYTPDSVQLKEVAKFLDCCEQANIIAKHLYISEQFEL